MHRLESSIKEHLAPVLKDDGFVGSGRTFRRISGDLIHVVQVQGSRYGGQFAVNLGIQPASIPDLAGNSPDATKIRPELCEFRRRLSEAESDQWWNHAGSKESMDAAVRAAASVYATIGRKLFAEMSGPESPLHNITPAQFEAGLYGFSGFGSTKVRMARSLALMRQSLGNLIDAGAFARIALVNLGGAPALRAELEQLCMTTEVALRTDGEPGGRSRQA
ncbi:hypothetical protein CQ14_10720 [Bradyrhizobium lablabi]|uniref:DUF4304 domain-containing protein n=1 Tax=Bradyrhizobium lablabi TaxID=722472 RepID=A0A0R3N6R0_9BRAD|nr:DUF4304 domain-containing protein [Bradyrhizobium lablabi]KRR25440.1 hypothetical protein CQ14_10720 [Bradyrhizobium lablabi]